MNNDLLFQYLLRLADNSLIYGQRLSEWCGHGPAVEEDIALTNTALDYIGQATFLFKEAARLKNDGRDEDQFAFTREEHEYRNFLLLELPNGDYARTIVRELLFTTWYSLYLQQLSNSSNGFLRGFAAKSLKEVKYHLKHATDWTLRMGDGTQESHERIQHALEELWAYTGELFEDDDLDRAAVLHHVAPQPSSLRKDWLQQLQPILSEATLNLPADGWFQSGGKKGIHTEHMGFLLAEMQFMQRAYPGAKW